MSTFAGDGLACLCHEGSRCSSRAQFFASRTCYEVAFFREHLLMKSPPLMGLIGCGVVGREQRCGAGKKYNEYVS